MPRTKKAGQAGILLIVGSIVAAFSKWYLVWWAQKIGGAELLGVYSLLLAFGTPLFVLSQLGLRTLFLTKFNAYPWRTYIILRIGGLLFATVLFLLLSSVFSVASPLLILGVLVFKVFDSIIDLDLGRIQYKGNLIKVGTITTFGALLSIILATLGYFITHTFWGVVVGSSLGSLLTSIFAMQQSQKISYTATTSQSGFKDLLRSSVPVTSAQLLSSLVMYLPILLLSVYSTPVVVGIYSGIAYLLTAASLVGASLSKLLITPLRNIYKASGSAAIFKKIHKLSIYSTIAATLASILLVVFGADVFQWIYGPQFNPNAVQLAILALASIFIIISFLYSTGLNVANRYHAINTAFVLACASTCLTGIVLFPLGISPLTTATLMALAGASFRALVMLLQSTRPDSDATAQPGE